MIKHNLSFFKKKHGNLLVVVVLLVSLVIVGTLMADRFFSFNNLLNVYEQSVSLSLASLGQTLAILSAGIDLSVGSMISLLSVLTSGFINGQTNRVFSVVAAIIALGGILGMINGLVILRLRIHPLIVTLGMGAVLQGLTLLYSRTPVGSVPLQFEYIAYGRLANLPVGATVTVAFFILVAFFLRYTPTGRHVYAIGDDAEVASILGLPISQTLIFVYGFSGICCALTAIYLVARFGVGQPYTGVNYTLASITPVVIGGTLLSGGKGGVVGTLLGVYLISLLNNLLNFLDISTHLQLVIQGLIIITAVSIYVEKKHERL